MMQAQQRKDARAHLPPAALHRPPPPADALHRSCQRKRRVAVACVACVAMRGL